MAFCRHVRIYLWKNAIEKKHTWLGSLCEILCPLLLVGLMVLLYSVNHRENNPIETYASDLETIAPLPTLLKQLEISDQYIALAPAGDVVNVILERAGTWFQRTDAADAFNQTALAMAGVTVGNWTVPSFADRVVVFDSVQDMENHITAKGYGTGSSKRIFAGITFDGTDQATHDWRYNIRMNHSLVPSSSGDRLDSFARSANFMYLSEYIFASGKLPSRMKHLQSIPGFETLQLTIDRMILNLPGAYPDAHTKEQQVLDLLLDCNLLSDPDDVFFLSQAFMSDSSAATSLTVSDLFVPQSVRTAPFPTAAFSTNPFYSAAKDVFALFFVLTALVPVSRLIRGIVHEKETRIREGMKMMGMGDAALNTAWFITYGVVFLIISVMSMVITMGNVFSHTTPLYIFLLFFLFGTSTVMCCFMISTFFSRSKTAAVLGMMIFFALFFPKYGLHSDTSEGGIVAASLCSPVAFGLGMDILSDLENNGVGVTIHTLNTKYENVTFTTCLIMLAIDTGLYFLLGWYFNKVFPNEFGVQLKPWFLCTPRYWCGASGKASKPQQEGKQRLLEVTNDSGAILEEVSDDLKAKERTNQCLKVKGLFKRFDTPDGVKVAVNNLNLTMYEGEIFCLLGHNGAGKSTTISMLTGLLTPSEGEAQIFGQDIRNSMDDLRKSMGVCPQHNVLFDHLTVMQHLQYFAAIKGIPAAEVRGECLKMIQEVGLVEKTHILSSQLSGGQKRKLSVAIALIGDSKVVFLDEPTSGMDPYSRRSTWQVLQNNRSNRIIVLTTHFMDEADLLGDRIGIMDEGSIRCCGSPMFLKSRYGVGYSLTAVKEPGCNTMVIRDLIKRHVPSAKTLSNVGAEISFQLPLDQSSHFPAMLTELDNNLHALRLETYGISVTTMEEVFLKVAQHGDKGFREQQRTKRSNSLSRPLSTGSAGPASSGGARGSIGSPGARGSLRLYQQEQQQQQQLSSDSNTVAVGAARGAAPSIRTRAHQRLFCTHFGALFQKRVRYFLRDKKAIAFQLLIPSIAIFFGMLLLKVSSGASYPLDPISTYPFNPSLDHVNPMTYVVQGNGMAGDILSHIPAANATFTPLTYEFVNSYVPTDFDPHTNSNTTATLLGTSYYLLDTRGDQAATRYGAYLITGDLKVGSGNVDLVYLQNTTSVDATPLFLNLVDSALLKVLWADDADKAGISVSNYPLPLTQLEHDLRKRIGALFAAIIIVFFMAFIPAAFIVFIVREREVAAKHQQLISGVSIPAYWFSSLAYDSLTYVLPAGIALAIIKGFEISQFVDDGTFVATFLLFALYGPASAAFVYMISFFFKSHSMAQNIVLLLNLLAVIALLVVDIMVFIPSMQHAGNIVRWICRFVPGFALGEGLLNLALRVVLGGLLDISDAPLGLQMTGEPLLFMGLGIPVYFGIAVLIDVLLSYPSIRAAIFRDPTVKDTPFEEDEDVVAERSRVDTPGTESDDAIRLSHIRKVYGNKKVAVKDLSFGIRHGECFGFLGINGAGKTTTLKILSGDEIRTSGKASLMGFDILKQQTKVRRLLGYCPQFDALLDLLTVREHLELFAKIKGVAASEVEGVVALKIREMDLVKFENKTAGSLSGGNKRKLSVAIAMMGRPPLMFLDEPSTGMDPVARRFMWKVIAEMAKTSSIVLVSHSMEECEALCNRVGIMVGGRMRCLGTIQHLKDRFGQGYLSEIKMGSLCVGEVQELVQLADMGANSSITFESLEGICTTLGDPDRVHMVNSMGSGWRVNAALAAEGRVSIEDFCRWWAEETQAAHICAFMKSTFPGATMSERHADRLRFKIPKTEAMRLSDMFGRIEDAKAPLNIEEYSLSQTSLEQIFNEFASQQEEETGAVRGMGAEEGGASESVATVPGTLPYRQRVPHWCDLEDAHSVMHGGAAGVGAGAGAGVGVGAGDTEYGGTMRASGRFSISSQNQPGGPGRVQSGSGSVN